MTASAGARAPDNGSWRAVYKHSVDIGDCPATGARDNVEFTPRGHVALSRPPGGCPVHRVKTPAVDKSIAIMDGEVKTSATRNCVKL